MLRSKKEKKSFTIGDVKDVKTQSIKDEKKFAKEIGAKLTPQSGAKRLFPGDMRLGDFMVEYKTTGFKVFTLSISMLKKLENEALVAGKEPVLVIHFKDIHNQLGCKKWVLKRSLING